MKNLIVALACIVTLTGCSLFSRSQPLEIVTEEKERTRLNLELPDPLSVDPVDWILVTPENIDDVWTQLQEDGKHPVLFAITSEGYEQLALSMAEIRNYIATQRLIIVQYRDYYEPEKQEQE